MRDSAETQTNRQIMQADRSEDAMRQRKNSRDCETEKRLKEIEENRETDGN